MFKPSGREFSNVALKFFSLIIVTNEKPKI